ncbi:AMP-binding protein [Rhabdothermincola salaria]|uniref:AMP-binding protein n=1 Tax=Rhabdothermincola salaria TaxID=2903142 RepID=UPI001E33CF8E|nr:AMP-binding protein [Rhabdothermincola salaria]
MNLASIVDPHPADAVALVVGDRHVTFGELRDLTGRARGGLRALGVEPGDRVAIVSGTDLLFVVTHLAVMGLGAISVPLNAASPAAALAHELRLTGASVLVAGRASAAVAGLDRESLPELEHVISADEQRWEELAAADPVDVVDRSPSDLAVLLFTSGTVGVPRPAMLTHGNLITNLDQVAEVPERLPQPGDVALGVLPLFHVFGLNVVLHLGLRTGSTVVLAPRFDPVGTLELVRRHHVTHIAGAPAMWKAWLELESAPDDALASVRVATSGAAKLPVEVAERFESRFGVHLDEGYGLTETSPVVTASTGTDSPYGSIGVPLPGIEVRLVDADGEPSLQDDPGELWVRGDNVFPGYWNDPEATARALTPDGWLRTGDLAVVDGEGHLFLVDRAKELILVSGFNVFPAEVEDVLGEHPDIEAVAVTGVPDSATGEAVKAWVVPAPGTVLDPDELREFCRRSLPRYKCPSAVHVVDALPVGLTGKVLRRALH